MCICIYSPNNKCKFNYFGLKLKGKKTYMSVSVLLEILFIWLLFTFFYPRAKNVSNIK